MTDASHPAAPVTLVTGGSTGIGAATVKRLVAAGHRVAYTGRNRERLAVAAGEIGRADLTLPIIADAGEYDAVQAAVTETVDRFGRLDHVVANAGFAVFDGLADADPLALKDMVLTNVLGPALLIKAALPALKENRGRVVLVGSVAGFKNSPGNFYGVTKWAVTALAENTRMQLTEHGVGVTLIAPGRVDTPFWSEGAPDGQMLTADHIADAIAWAIGQPDGVDINTVVVRPFGQAV
ncbi:NADP-dependent 3-hydroxy acid dehydrogenase YdfG [Herbihabitans rhizosphaerae]|uniref:NADP-dependent 3-hydroxy acid dehydrogenase YdfG n=1 Tax=Herbihabitans rhizosphaerae TaxID=1872711 RepID=A0A4Q7KR09_9PSEU|nr:SDR family oxidoreductase [Herbihabitans rhizosphaerae]RZS39298.1 NADP-dependent 3-hydroxy acid dehydrogenase YdfG [Herbihabitans rhizosphaerae]